MSHLNFCAKRIAEVASIPILIFGAKIQIYFLESEIIVNLFKFSRQKLTYETLATFSAKIQMRYFKVLWIFF